ncbi:hypothetical protein PsYK624_125530 [Phanerochaete sordida]|uniref:Uncharacterized protein n=1 Tax=Phanerochaete sordida TaxID=48140 RepID=A0A9P3LIN6_9APHY|nr:hypothetical protein PsYK624_125530 [Phanerochaete sordida]
MARDVTSSLSTFESHNRLNGRPGRAKPWLRYGLLNSAKVLRLSKVPSYRKDGITMYGSARKLQYEHCEYDLAVYRVFPVSRCLAGSLRRWCHEARHRRYYYRRHSSYRADRLYLWQEG